MAARKVADLPGQRVAGDELEVAAVVLHVLDEVVEQQVQPGPVAVAHARRQADLVDQQLGGVEHAGRLGEELVLRRAVAAQVGLVQRARRLLDQEVLRPARSAAAARRSPRAVAPIDRDSFIVSPARLSRPASRSWRTRGGKKSSSQPWTAGIRPDQKIERPPKLSCGFSPM